MKYGFDTWLDQLINVSIRFMFVIIYYFVRIINICGEKVQLLLLN